MDSLDYLKWGCMRITCSRWRVACHQVGEAKGSTCTDAKQYTAVDSQQLKKRQYYKEERDTINCTNWHDDGAISQTASPQRFLMALHLVRHTKSWKLKESLGKKAMEYRLHACGMLCVCMSLGVYSGPYRSCQISPLIPMSTIRQASRLKHTDT